MVCSMLPIMAIPAAAEEAAVTEYMCLDVGEGAYIDTGIIPTSETHVIMVADVEKTQNGAAVFGVGYNADGANYSFHVNSTDSEYGAGFGLNMSWSDAKIQDGRQIIELSKELLKVDDVSAEYEGDMDGTCTFDHRQTGGLPMYLFAINFFGNEVQTFAGQHIRFYSCAVYEGDDLAYDFIPATQINDAGVKEVGVYDRVGKTFYANQGDGNMIPYSTREIVPAIGLPSGTSNEGVVLTFDGTLTISENTTINALPTQSAMLIGGNVTIDIKEGVTLTVNGGDASGRFGAGAGIEVPEGATLTITGGGTLKAKGGNATAGENGEWGDKGTARQTLRTTTEQMASGKGGNGGYGGGGAGAGIGGRGGDGGAGGAGGASFTVDQSTSAACVNGNPGENGKNGTAGGIGGKITVSDTLKGKIQGGSAFAAPSQGGGSGDTDQGIYDLPLLMTGFSNVYVACGGGGGGAGGNGYPGAGIGNGGAGAGGGGGGGSGFTTYWFYNKDANATNGAGHFGTGGAGVVNGCNGSDKGPEANAEGLVAGAGGKGGVAGGGSASGDKVVYLDEATRAEDMKCCLDVNTGAYFDIGYVPTENTRVVFDAEVNTNGWAALFGVIWHDNDHGSASHNYYVNSSGEAFGFGFGVEDAKWADDAPVLAGRHTIELDNYALKCDGVSKEEHKASDFSVNGNSMYLCGINIDGVAQTFEEQHIRFYSCQISENGELVCDFVPTTVGNTAMLLDRKTGLLYANKGSGYIAYNPIETTENTATGSVLSNGSLTIVVGVAAAVIFGLGGFFLGKKKKPAAANGANTEDEE